jgi:hypothetical protein
MLREFHDRVQRMMRNEARTGMPRVRRPGSGYVPSPFVQELLDFQKKMRELDPGRGRLHPDTEPEQPYDELLDSDSEKSAEKTEAAADEEGSTMPYECYGCGKKMEDYYSANRTYFRDYHYCQDCTENGTKEEKEHERTEALSQELKRWGEHLRERFESE